MDLKNSKFVIVELIPTSLKKETGEIIQLSALKLDGVNLIDRFDYRLDESLVPLKDFIDMFSYDKDSFTYLSSSDSILEKFKEFVGDLPILIIEENYTKNYLSGFTNHFYNVFDYLNIEKNDDSIQTMINKYKLEFSNYIVDLVYEALIKEVF